MQRILGVDRSKLPDNVNEFFGLFASERANVMKAVDYVRQSSLIGSAIPVHGLMVDIQSGQLEWLVNGYNALGTATPAAAQPAVGNEWNLPSFNLGEMKFPEIKIGEVASAPPAETIHSVAEPAHVDAPKLKLKQSGPIPLPPRIPPPRSRRD